MKSLSPKSVQHIWQQMNVLDVPGIEKLGMQFYHKQPAVYEYVVSRADTPDFNQDERELLLYLAIGVWQMMVKALPRFPTPKPIPPAALEEAEMVNKLLLEEADAPQLQGQIDDHVQPAIMANIKEVVESKTNEVSVRPASRTPMVIILTTILDCLADIG